jgi:hypothetical protein
MNWINLSAVDILVAIDHLAIHTGGWDKIIHSIETSDQCALSAAGWPNYGCDPVARDI